MKHEAQQNSLYVGFLLEVYIRAPGVKWGGNNEHTCPFETYARTRPFLTIFLVLAPFANPTRVILATLDESDCHISSSGACQTID
jgi:hypothetical protein